LYGRHEQSRKEAIRVESFAITIRSKVGASWPIVVELSGAKTPLPIRREGVLELDLEALSTQVTPRDYGMLLGQALFRDRIREAFLQARTQSEDRLSVQLFVEAPDLRTLRWERLCAPVDEQWRFLLFDQRTPLTLALPSAADRRFPPTSRADLRALLVVASPHGLERYRLAPFDVAATVSSVRSALGTIACDVLSTTPDAVGLPTLDALCERLTSTSYTLLHVVCHGRYSTDISDTVLYLENEEHQVDPVTASRLLDRLSQLQGERGLPHFVFLATCESASAQAEGALGGLAQRLVRELGLPAALARTEPVSLRTAEALTGTFYQRLYVHGYLDLALAEACAGLAEQPDSTVAALYSRLGTRPLFERETIRIRTNVLDYTTVGYLFNSAVSLVTLADYSPASDEDVRQYYEGAPFTWNILVAQGDVKRDMSDELIQRFTSSINRVTMLCLSGEPGAGKSTLAWRLATEVAQSVDRPLLHILNNETDMVWYQLRDVSQQYQTPLVVLVDDVFRDRNTRRALASLRPDQDILIIATSRSNDIPDDLRLPFPLQIQLLDGPTPNEKRRVLQKLKLDENSLGGPQRERLRKVDSWLIFMSEISTGEEWKKIVRNTVNRLKEQDSDKVVYRAYEYLCYAGQYDIGVPETLIAALDDKGHFYNLPEHPISKGLIFHDSRMQERVRTRHPIIAREALNPIDAIP
jgi:hypothetical protein